MNLDYLKEENQITFIPEGLAAEAGSLTFTIPDNPAHVSMKFGDFSNGDPSRLRQFPVNTLASHMQHNGIPYIDVLKLDIEGTELGLLEQLFQQDYFPFTQLLIEFHTQYFKAGDKSRYQNILRQLDTRFHLIGKKSDGGTVLEYVKKDDIPWCVRPNEFQRHV